MQCFGLKGETLLFDAISLKQCSTVGPFMMQKVSFDMLLRFTRDQTFTMLLFLYILLATHRSF